MRRTKKLYTVGSLFAGVGGICLGFQNAKTKNSGYELEWANEIDEYACETYRTNFNHPLFEGDIKKILSPQEAVDGEINTIREKVSEKTHQLNENQDSSKKDKLQEEIRTLERELDDLVSSREEEIARYEEMHDQLLASPIDILTGGFPCQAFSIAGEQLGFSDPRGNLFLSIVELINQLGERYQKPRVLFLENVKNLQNHDNGNTYKTIKSKLEDECGYTIYEHVLNTMDYSNLPQNRERIYIIGFRDRSDAEAFTLFDQNGQQLKQYKRNKTKKQRIADIESVIDSLITYDTAEKYYYTPEKYPKYFISEDDGGSNYSKDHERINLYDQITQTHKFYQIRRGMYIRENQSDVCPTLTANMGTGGHNVPLIKDKDGIRKITPAEAFRLQGFPVGNGYELPVDYEGRPYSDSHLYKQAGNAVSVPVITLLAKEILKVLEEGDLRND